VLEAGKRLGLDALLAAMQILDQTLSRMRYSTQGRILAELALVRIGHLDDLDELSAVIAQLQAGIAVGPTAAERSIPAGPAAMAAKKKLEPAVAPPLAKDLGTGNSPYAAGQASASSPSEPISRASAPASATPAVTLTAENAVEIWNLAVSRLSGMIADQARQFDSVAISAPNRLVVRFKSGYDLCKSACERPEQVARFEQALADVVGQRISIEFALAADEPGQQEASMALGRGVSPHQLLLEATRHPLVQRASELFGAQPVRVDDSPLRE
jgi:DNA polymerase-3 subunit gamma/tau